MCAIVAPWGTIALEPEVSDWLAELSDNSFGQAAFAIDRLATVGVMLGEPYSRQLHGKLRELRMYVSGERVRVAYFVASERRIILLTVFTKTQRRDQPEIDRARLAMLRCIAEEHTAEAPDD